MADTSISFSGLSTGIDSASLIKALVEAKKQPITILQRQIDSDQSTIDNLDQFTTKLSALRAAALGLSTRFNFSAFTSTSSNTDVVNVSASSAASEGNHNVVVQQLAGTQTSKGNQTFNATTVALGYAGTLTFRPSGTSASAPASTVSVASTDTLENVRDKINNSSVKAFGTVTLTGVPVAGSKLTVDGKSYEFYDSTAGAYTGKNVGVDVNGVATAADAAAALAAAATGANKGAGSTMSANGAVITVTADAAGSGGNNVAMKIDADTGGALLLSGDNLTGGGVPAYTASIVNIGSSSAPAYSLVFTGKSTGASGAFTAAYAPTAPGDPKTMTFSNTQDARDAIIDVDGITGLHRSTNVISDAITGVTLSLVDAPADKPSVAVVVGKDAGNIRSKVQAFVTAYNDLRAYIRANTAFDAVSKKGGPLMGEMAVSLVSDRLRSSLVSVVPGLTGSFSALSRAGITTQSDGTMSIDSTKFDKALGADFQGVVDLFSKNLTTGTQGVASQIADQIDRWMSPVDGLVTRRKSTLQEDIIRLSGQIDQKQSAVDAYETALKLKYSNLEQLVSTLKDQSSSLNSLAASV